MKIVSINKGRSRQRLKLELEDGSVLELATEIVLSNSISAGDAVPPERMQALLRQDQEWNAREAALRLLSHRPRTEAELRLRLLRKEFPVEVVEGCIARLREQRLLDDQVFAEMFARDRVRLNPRGRRRIVQELRSRGVDGAAAESAVEAAMGQEEVNELQLALEAARRWRRRDGEELARAQRRLAGYLARRGFGGETVRRVVEDLLPGD